jgi:hypothetical protein
MIYTIGIHFVAEGVTGLVDGAGRVFGSALCEELKRTAIDHRRGQRRRSNSEEAFQRLAARYHTSVQYDNLGRHWQRRDA